MSNKYILYKTLFQKVKMVAAGVQTNGFTVGVRRLTKSFSEVGGDRLVGREGQNEVVNAIER